MTDEAPGWREQGGDKAPGWRGQGADGVERPSPGKVWAGHEAGGEGFQGLSAHCSVSSVRSQISTSALIAKARNILITCCLHRKLMNRHSELMPNRKPTPVLWRGQPRTWVCSPPLQRTVFASTSLGFHIHVFQSHFAFPGRDSWHIFCLVKTAIALRFLAAWLLLNWRPGPLKFDIPLHAASHYLLACGF